jgi:arabinose operon protein AraL
MFRGFIFDLDGTVYLSDALIPGADEVIRLLRESGRKVSFLSNKPIQTREDYASKLTRLGIPTRPDEVINSTFVMTNYLKKTAPGARLFVVGETPFVEELKRGGDQTWSPFHCDQSGPYLPGGGRRDPGLRRDDCGH